MLWAVRWVGRRTMFIAGAASSRETRKNPGDANFVGCVQLTNILAQALDFQEDVCKLECFLKFMHFN